MELHSIRGGTKEDLETRKYNIGIGISLGNRWFTVENIIGLIRWALPRARENVIVYVADSIHAINIEVRKEVSHKRALEIANQMGTEILSKVKEEAEKVLSSEDTVKLRYVKWDEIADKAYKEKTKYLYALYDVDETFRETLRSIVRDFVSKEPLKFKEKEIDRLAHYIIEELPEQITRVQMAGMSCNAFAYPYDGAISELAEDIWNDKKFPNIKEKILDTEPKVFLEVR